MIKDVKNDCREESTESDPFLRHVDQYPKGDEATLSYIKSLEEAFLSFEEVILTESEPWRKKLKTLRIIACKIESKDTNNELKRIISSY
ncbi:hypothetical protein PanWU01x14_011870, partial [Parasponia andersonii]